MIPGIQEIKALAIKYSKKQLANMAQTGLIDPQKAVMAGMMRDRIAKEDMQPPTTTVAQDTLGLSPQPQMAQMPPAPQGPQMPPQMGMQPSPQMAQARPQMGAPVEQPPVMAASGGMTSLPVEIADYAGGGIVAFGDGGDVPGYAGDAGSFVYSPFKRAVDSFLDPIAERMTAMNEREQLQNKIRANFDPYSGVGGFFTPQTEEHRVFAQQVLPNLNSMSTDELRRLSEIKPQPTSKDLKFSNTSPAPAPAPAATDAAPAPAPPKREVTTRRDTTSRAGRNDGPRVSTGPTTTGSSLLDAPTLPTYTPVEAPTIPSAPVLGAFDPNKIKIKGEDLPIYTARERRDIGKARRAAELEEGADPEMFTKMIKGVEEKKGKLEKRAGEAGGEALMQFGLGLIGARKGEEAQTVRKSATEALNSYRQDRKDLRAADEKYDERIEALRMSDQQAKLTGARADVAQAEQDRQLAFNADVERRKAKNDLAKSSALIGAQLYGTEAQHGMEGYKTGVTAAQQQYNTQQQAASKHFGDMVQAATQLHNIKQQAVTAERGHQIEMYRAQLAYSASMYNSSVIKQAGLDERRSRTLIEASDSFIKSNKDSMYYADKPQLLQQDALNYARTVEKEFMNRNPKGTAPPRTTGNRPSLDQFQR